MYHAAETDPMLTGARSPASGKPTATGSGSVRTMRLESPAPKCNDWFFAVLFVVNVLAIAIFAVWLGIPAVMEHVKTHHATVVPEPTAAKDQDFTMVFSLAAALMGISVVVSGIWMRFLMGYAASLIRIALWLNVIVVVAFALASFAVNPIMAIVFLFMAALNVCYIYAVRNRIAFASANLKAACAAVSAHMGVFLVAVFMVIKQFAWLLLWSLSAIGVYQHFKESDPECANRSVTGNDEFGPQKLCGGPGAGVALFFMLLSVYWGQQVIQNVLTCTTAGVVATWWYQPHAKNVTFGAFYRSLTTSFGSICFGSLIVAVLQALRTMASMLKEKAREEDNAALACVACMAECVLNCLENIMEYINMWAYVYVGIYGYDFRTSGKAVTDLFANRGWTAVINDDLTSTALTFGAMGVGFVGCVIGLLMVKFSPEAWFLALGSKDAAYGVLGTIGFISGLGMAMVLANVVITALHTVFVCFAEDPIAFSRNHPHEYETLVNGWRQFHGDALVCAYGTAV